MANNVVFDWLKQLFETERVTYAKTMHDDVDTEAAMAMYACQMHHPELQSQEQEQKQEQKQEQNSKEEQGKEDVMDIQLKRNRRGWVNERSNAQEGDG
ncbi:hypothetical protein CDV36_015959 [Fusarium kuroshium]|uniref:Uncharacterized protein n=1 Tax=Fusarium kuroshium TaxID=2010991 RepID=A0A3M2R3K4_9HYPO|nr:hypothetical protein CDV36_015959 [Fusarium kuroshium]